MSEVISQLKALLQVSEIPDTLFEYKIIDDATFRIERTLLKNTSGDLDNTYIPIVGNYQFLTNRGGEVTLVINTKRVNALFPQIIDTWLKEELNKIDQIHQLIDQLNNEEVFSL